jgi:pimeloyl-ACP methyl ester carboxylesterase
MIRKGFVDLPHGQVHFRYAGQGPPILLLHDSPRSSAMHAALIEELADEFTIIALDTPGYGHSSPLPGEPRPEIPDFARALAATQAALGIERCAIYGFHTSSKILLQFALDHPQRVALAIIDGLNLPPGGPGDAFIARYMKPLTIEEDGSHLAAGWSRAREFMRFFPWFDSSPRSRLNQDFPTDDYLHGYALDLLTAGPHFSDAYSAAMRYLATPLVSGVRAPTVFMCRSNDPLFAFLDSLPTPLPAGCRIERLGPERDRWQAFLREQFRSARSSTTPASAPGLGRARAADGTTPAVRRRYRDGTHGQWHLREAGGASGSPVLLLPETPGSSAGLLPLLAEFATTGRPVWAPDLPGQGETAAVVRPDGKPPALSDFVDALLGLLETNAKEPVDIVASFSASPLALAAAARSPGRIRSVVCDGIPLLGAGLRKQLARLDCPPLAVSRDGSHLLALWHQLRDRELCWPWYERSAAAIRRVQPDLGALRMDRMTLDLARQLPHYGALNRAIWTSDYASLLATVPQPVLLFKDPGDPRLAASLRARRRLPLGQLVKRPDSVANLLAVVGKFWKSLAEAR